MLGCNGVSRTRRSKPIDGGKETERESEQKKDMVVGGSEHPTNKICLFVFSFLDVLVIITDTLSHY